VLEVQRGTRRMSVRVPVAERNADTGRLSDLVGQQTPILALGVLALNVTPRIAELLPGLRRDKGVVVATVSSGSPFSQQGRLQPGDVIHALNGKPVDSVADLTAAAAALTPGSAAVLHLERAGALMYLSFRAER
jgi:serine protease Do